MAHAKPRGSFVALITPMNSDGTIDYEGFGSLIKFHEENGTEALLIMGLDWRGVDAVAGRAAPDHYGNSQDELGQDAVLLWLHRNDYG